MGGQGFILKRYWLKFTPKIKPFHFLYPSVFICLFFIFSLFFPSNFFLKVSTPTRTQYPLINFVKPVKLDLKDPNVEKDDIRRSELPMLYCRPDSPDQEWGFWLTGVQGAKVVQMATRYGINGPRIITPSGSVGSYNPTPLPFTPTETFQDGYGERVQAVMPMGHEVDAVRGPLPRWQRSSKITRVQKRNFERQCFGVGEGGVEMEENDWLKSHAVPKLIPEL